MERSRRHFTAEEKAVILREHLVDRVAVSNLCEKHGVKPTVFYRWQKELFDNLSSFLDRKGASQPSGLVRENEALRAKLTQKDAVIAQIMEDFIAAKQTHGVR